MRAVAGLLLLVIAAQGAEGLAPAKAAEIEKLISEEMSRQGIPAVSVAVGSGGAMLWSAGYGLADVENYVPAKASTMYRLGSISKPITAVAAMQLAEAGKIDLDAPIDRYVAGFPRKRWPVTVRQLLGHLGGIRHYRNPAEINSTKHYDDLAATLRQFQEDGLVAEPGTKYSYTTYGYVLLGLAVENASGVRFLDYLRTRIFRPAGMERIRDDHTFAIIPNRARGYVRVNGDLRNCALADTSNKIPGGGLASTAEDLIRFELALESDRLLKPAARDSMYQRQRLRGGGTTAYGLGWSVARNDRRLVVFHTGGQQGVSTILKAIPRDRISVALMCNLEKADLRPLSDRILRVLGGTGDAVKDSAGRRKWGGVAQPAAWAPRGLPGGTPSRPR
ncbi:MAG: serine hydrolase domain-containing protein [Bryobacteraceae bacterium]